MPKIKIRCEGISRQSGKRCRAKGYFTPTSRRMLCRFHGGSQSTDSKTRKYKGLYNNKNVSIQNQIKRLKMVFIGFGAGCPPSGGDIQHRKGGGGRNGNAGA